MKKYLYFLFAAFVAVGLSACSPDEKTNRTHLIPRCRHRLPILTRHREKRSLCITALQIMCIPSSAICRRR